MRVGHRLLPASSHRVQRHALDDVEPEAVDAGNLTRVVGQQADLVQPQVDEHLRAEAELAQRRVARRAVAAGGGGGASCTARGLELVRTSPRGRDVDERPAARLLDLARWPRAGACPPSRGVDAKTSATVDPECTRQSGGGPPGPRGRPSRARGTGARRRCPSRRRRRATRCPSGRGRSAASATRRTRRSVKRRYWMRSAIVRMRRPCFCAKSSRSGIRAIVPSSFMISQMTPAGVRSARRARSTEPSVCPVRTSTPPLARAQREDVAGRDDVVRAARRGWPRRGWCARGRRR